MVYLIQHYQCLFPRLEIQTLIVTIDFVPLKICGKYVNDNGWHVLTTIINSKAIRVTGVSMTICSYANVPHLEVQEAICVGPLV